MGGPVYFCLHVITWTIFCFNYLRPVQILLILVRKLVSSQISTLLKKETLDHMITASPLNFRDIILSW